MGRFIIEKVKGDRRAPPAEIKKHRPDRTAPVAKHRKSIGEIIRRPAPLAPDKSVVGRIVAEGQRCQRERISYQFFHHTFAAETMQPVQSFAHSGFKLLCFSLAHDMEVKKHRPGRSGKHPLGGLVDVSFDRLRFYGDVPEDIEAVGESERALDLEKLHLLFFGRHVEVDRHQIIAVHPKKIGDHPWKSRFWRLLQ